MTIVGGRVVFRKTSHGPAQTFRRADGHIGTDESGKGDYFGPLVIAGFYLPKTPRRASSASSGSGTARPSRTSAAATIAEDLRAGYFAFRRGRRAGEIQRALRRMRNLNKLLAWGHARVIENILERVPGGRAVTDQFGDERFVRDALLKKGRTIELVQRPRAEEDAAVAAASILARAEFLKRLAILGREWGMDLPKGAGAAGRPGGGRTSSGSTGPTPWPRSPRPISKRPSGCSGRS